jgi:hypothetical protein
MSGLFFMGVVVHPASSSRALWESFEKKHTAVCLGTACGGMFFYDV